MTFHEKSALVPSSWELPKPSACFCARKRPTSESTKSPGSFSRLPLPRSQWREGTALLSLPRQGVELVGSHLASLFGQVFDDFAPDDSLATSATLTDHSVLMMMPLSVVVFGATGDLARKKLFPALYQLCVLGLLPRDLKIVAISRKAVERDVFVSKQCVHLREDPRFSKEDFCARIDLHAGGYDAPDAFVSLDKMLAVHENAQHDILGTGLQGGNRLFLIATPPVAFASVCELIATYARASPPTAAGGGGFTRVMVEKPLGRDASSFAALHQLISRHLKEEELFRVDHYLGKEVILNIPSLRWANQLFEPTWNANYIESVQLTFKEDLGTGGRGGFFDREGIIRDVIQPHLMQAFLWLAIEPPKSMRAADITKAKLELLRRVSAVSLDADETFLAQYTACDDEPGYLDDETVPHGSRCPTFASLVLRVDNERWRGVPFLFTAGKGMDERVCELRVRYKPHALNKMMDPTYEHRNELVMRVQPDEALYMLTVAKEPGITAEHVRKQVCMDMRYASQFADCYVGDAYERIVLSAGRGDQSLFVSAEELAETWRIFTPLLNAIDERKPQPTPHPFGLLPPGFVEWAAGRGVAIHPTWKEFVAMHADLIDEIVRVFSELDVDNSGGLDAKEVANLARRFFDGREPTPKRVAAIFRGFDVNEDGLITLDELIAGSQKLHRAFSRDCNQGGAMDEATEHVHI